MLMRDGINGSNVSYVYVETMGAIRVRVWVMEFLLFLQEERYVLGVDCYEHVI